MFPGAEIRRCTTYVFVAAHHCASLRLPVCLSPIWTNGVHATGRQTTRFWHANSVCMPKRCLFYMDGEVRAKRVGLFRGRAPLVLPEPHRPYKIDSVLACKRYSRAKIWWFVFQSHGRRLSISVRDRLGAAARRSDAPQQTHRLCIGGSPRQGTSRESLIWKEPTWGMTVGMSV